LAGRATQHLPGLPLAPAPAAAGAQADRALARGRRGAGRGDVAAADSEALRHPESQRRKPPTGLLRRRAVERVAAVPAVRDLVPVGIDLRRLTQPVAV